MDAPITQAGIYHQLVIDRIVEQGAYLRAQPGDILLPKRFLPAGAREEDVVEVFIYHDSESRLIATTQKPFGVVGDIVYLKVVSQNQAGAFMDWGLMKDIFVPVSQQREPFVDGNYYFVKIYRDEATGRTAATQKFAHLLQNDNLTVAVKEEVDLVIHRETNIGYEVFINSQHIGLVHFDDAFLPIKIGDRVRGFVSRIRDGNLIDIRIGSRGYGKVSGEAEKIFDELKAAGGYLPFNDKSDPENIYKVFGMSKKTFKMAVGQLLRERRISLTQTGFKAAEE